MDSLHSHSDNPHLNQGHVDDDINVRGIAVFAVILVVGGICAFAGSYYFLSGLEWWQKRNDAKLTPMEQRLQKERTKSPKTAVPENGEGLKPPPDWFGPGKAEDHVRATFREPRLQFDDTHDMNVFLHSEDTQLQAAGKGPDGSIRIPITRAMDILAQRGLPPVSGTFSTAKPQMPAPSPTVWQEVPASGAQSQKNAGGANW